MSNKIKSGTYSKAKIKDYGLSKSQTGTPCVFVQFEFVEKTDAGDQIRRLTWRSYFTEKAKEKTVETLIKIFKYQGDDGSDIANGIGSNVLNESQEYDLVIEKEEYNNELHDKIRWVNLPGSGGGKVEKLSKSEASVLLGGMSLKGEFLSQKQNMPAQALNPSGAADDDIPF